MKLYIYEGGWEGGLAVMAESKEKALELFKEKTELAYRHKIKMEDIEEFDVNTPYEFFGDR